MSFTDVQLVTLSLLTVIAASIYALAFARLWQLGNPQLPQPIRVVITHEQASPYLSTIRSGVVDATGRWYVVNGQRKPLPNGVRLAPGTIMVLSHVPGSHVAAWADAR